LRGGEGSNDDSVRDAAAASLKGGRVALEMVEAVEDEPFANSELAGGKETKLFF
jgi:hypothetical protein